MNWLGKLWKTDPESFKGKMYLLLFEKFLLGAIIATAFVVYDRYKESDAHKFQTDLIQLTQRLEKERATAQQKLEQERATTQQTLERTRILGELIPLLKDPRGDPLARAYLLRSAVKTDLIDADGAVDLASDLFIDALTHEQFARVMSVVIPDGVSAIARQGVKLSQVWRRSGEKEPLSAGGTYNLSVGRSEEMLKIFKRGQAWRLVLIEALPVLDSVHYDELERALSNHLYGLFILMSPDVLIEPGDPFKEREQSLLEARNLSQRSSRAVRLVGNISGELLNDPEASQQISRELTRDYKDLDNILTARVIIQILSHYGRSPMHHGQRIAEPLSRILTKRQNNQSLSPEIQSAYHELQLAAGELLQNIDATSAEQILIEFISRFYREAAKINPDDHEALMELTGHWDEEQLGFAVIALFNVRSQKAKAALEQLIGLQKSTARRFPQLMESIEAQLRNWK